MYPISESRCAMGRAFFSGVVVTFVMLAAVAAGTGTVAAQSAPDCSIVTYDGSGTDADPYEVGNVDQLQCINEQGLSENYTQVSDIDASGTSAWKNGDGFFPIANDTDGGSTGFQGTKFTGSFDGKGYNISDLRIGRRNTDYVGVFGFLDSRGRLENVTLNNIIVSGNSRVGALVGQNGGPAGGGTIEKSYATGGASGDNRVGGLVGQNFGTVTGSYSIGTVTGTSSVSGTGFVGGLVGENGARTVSDPTIKRSYATGSVSGNGFRVGGLVGKNNVGSNITESYATGGVSGGSDTGGLVGDNNGNVTESYATGGVTASDTNTNIGGLIGSNGGTVRKSYATGNVSIPSDFKVGGLVGATSFSGGVTDSYWDTETTGQSTSDGGTGLTTSEMTGSAATSNMVAFDFTSTWETVTNPDDYPVLAWQVDTQLFTQPLIDRFSGPPTNIPKDNGGFNDTLYEDLDGDGDGTDVSPTVAVFGELIRGKDLNGDAPDGGLTDEQARALNWNQGSPETEVTPADMVSLFGEQIRA